MNPAPLSIPSGLLVEQRGPVVHLTLNRPDKRNALSKQLIIDLETNLRRLASIYRTEKRAATEGRRRAKPRERISEEMGYSLAWASKWMKKPCAAFA